MNKPYSIIGKEKVVVRCHVNRTVASKWKYPPWIHVEVTGKAEATI